MDFKRHRKLNLNLNAPILSTRRISSVVAADTRHSSSSIGTIQNTSERIPFSWEKAAGKPKYIEKSVPESNEAPESDVEDVDDFFSDAMDDVFSLSEALDIVQKRSEKANSENNDGLKLKLAESNGYQSPTYMINRFLPDATALAASSSSAATALNFEENVCDTCSSYSARHSCDSSCLSPKGCGLELVFPWVKHKFCAVESPVMPCSTNMQKHRRDSKEKKHRRSASYIPCTNVKKDI